MEAIDLFLTWYQEHPDYDEFDSRAEFDRMLVRNRLAIGAATGKNSIEDLLDCLNDQDMNPDQYVAETIGAMEETMLAGITFAPDASGLLLPR